MARDRVVRAGIVVTGTEVLTGRVADRNGPWLAERLRLLGLDVAHVVVVGDRPGDLAAALEFAASSDLVITTGGLGPTADDLTAEVVARFQGRAMLLDDALERRIAAIVATLAARFGGQRDPAATAAATRKQAMVPLGAGVLEPVGTAPGLVVPPGQGRPGPPVVVLPGPPGELRAMWPAAVAAPAVQAVLRGANELRQDTLRLWGVPESELAALLRSVDGELTGLEVTTCLREGELEIVSRYQPEAAGRQVRLRAAVGARFPAQLFSPDGASIDELISAALEHRGWSVAVLDAATDGALVTRLMSGAGAGPSRPASGVLGGLVSASGADPIGLPGVPADLLAEAGPHPPTARARALAAAARTGFGADVGVGVSLVDASTAAQLAVITPATECHDTVQIAGMSSVARRVVPALLHLLLQALGGSTGGASDPA